jgi:hypothetical protein
MDVFFKVNSAVIVDVKLAFRQYKDSFPNPDEVIPIFSFVNGPWFRTSAREVFEVWGGKCRKGHNWCARYEDNIDYYFDHQRQQREKAGPISRLLIEEYELQKLNSKDGLNNFKKYLDDNKLIQLLPGVLPGFALRNRKWYMLNIDMLEAVKQEDNWNDLVLPKGHRKMVQGMVETHARGVTPTISQPRERVQMDLVRGKGTSEHTECNEQISDSFSRKGVYHASPRRTGSR